MDLTQIFQKILWWIVLPFSCISFCITPLTNDTRIFIGAAAIADRFYPLPYGWDAAYEVKPIGNRILNWIFYKVADSVIPFISNNYFWFGVIIKICALVILIGCCWYVSRRICKDNVYTFPLLILAFVCQANFGIMMAEWFAVLFSLVTTALLLEENKNWSILAGVLIVGIALLKGITSLMVIPVICAIYLLGRSVKWRCAATGFIISSATFLILCATFWPYQLLDIFLSGKVAHVGHFTFTTLLSYFWITQTSMSLPVFLITYIPIVACGFPILLIVSTIYLSRNDYARLALLAIMWLIPAMIVIIQSEFIGYHYLVLAFPAVITILLFMQMRPKYKWVIPAIIGFLVATLIVFNCFFGSYSLYEYSFWASKERNADIINDRFDLNNQSELLYLDPGDAPYYFHANSSCRYITPMPVQRNDPQRWNLTAWPQYSDNRDCILKYQGEYILTDVSNGSLFSYSFFRDPDIAAMIANNYTKVSSASWEVFRKR